MEPDSPYFSLAGRFALIVVVASSGGAAAGVGAQVVLGEWPVALVLAGLAGMILGLLLTHVFVRPAGALLEALADGLRNLNDQDYSSGVARTRNDELGQVVDAYNALSATLRDERLSLHQRELLLDTVIQSADLALLLTNESGTVIYDNPGARKLLLDGQSTLGRSIDAVIEQADSTLAEATRQRRQGLFTIALAGESETYHLAYRTFRVNNQRNHLYLYKQLTHELSRQELATWKRLIRVISHELNNSLAPILSLSHSARQLADRPDGADRLRDVLDTVAGRAAHLREFISGYVEFARLPKPRCRWVEWGTFLRGLENLDAFDFQGTIPDSPGYFDPVQMEQVLINLLRNAHQSGSSKSDVTLSVTQNDQASLITISDRGTGMDDATLRQALLPFYSTKPEGSGLGLALCREILEGHGGRLRLVNRKQGGVSAICELPKAGEQ